MGAKWGHVIKLQRGLRLVQRHTAQGAYWYCEERRDGRRTWRSLGTSDVKEAKRLALAGPEEVPAAPTFPVSPKSVTPDALTLDRAFEEYDKWFLKSHRESGYVTTVPVIERFVDMVGAETETRAVTREHVQKFIDQHEGRSPVYVRNQFARVRAFLRWIDRKHRDAVDLHALKGVELPKDESVTEEVPPLEVFRAILRKVSAHPWMGDYCTVLLETGMRPGELLAVRGCDLRGDLLDIKPHSGWAPKSKWSVRTIQLSPAAAEILKRRAEALFDKKFPIFGTSAGTIRDPKDVGSKTYRDAMRDERGEIPADWKGVNLYLWRHAFCSLHAQEGPAFMDLQKMSSYIGHAPGSTHTLEKWYVDRRALRRGAPVSLVGESKDGRVTELRAGG